MYWVSEIINCSMEDIKYYEVDTSDRKNKVRVRKYKYKAPHIFYLLGGYSEFVPVEDK